VLLFNFVMHCIISTTVAAFEINIYHGDSLLLNARPTRLSQY